MVARHIDTTAPFHPGEQHAQDRMGVREKLDQVGRKHIRDHMPDQHRAFYAQLPFVLLGTVDDRGRPWASIVPGRPGFLSTPDPQRLEIAARPLFGDPLNENLRPGTEIGLLGLQPETRRRNRLSGTVRTAGPDGIAIDVSRTFGNCPKYIQTRTVEVGPNIDTPETERPRVLSDRFSAEVAALIARSDTLFVATAYLDGPAAPSRGVDVSHRGGKPGFVRLEDERTFVLPDFSGNLHFNTVGNIVSNPKAGFLFVDFDSGDLVYLTGEAQIDWDSADVHAYAGAERLIRFRAATVIHVAGGLPLRFEFGDYSPNLARTGGWQTVNPG